MLYLISIDGEQEVEYEVLSEAKVQLPHAIPRSPCPLLYPEERRRQPRRYLFEYPALSRLDQAIISEILQLVSDVPVFHMRKTLI